MPPASSAILYEIDDIVTAIEHVIVTALEEVGPEGIKTINYASVLNPCRIILQECIEIKFRINNETFDAKRTPVEQGDQWQAGPSYDDGFCAKYINTYLLNSEIPGWLRKTIVNGHFDRTQAQRQDWPATTNLAQSLVRQLVPLNIGLVQSLKAAKIQSTNIERCTGVLQSTAMGMS